MNLRPGFALGWVGWCSESMDWTARLQSPNQWIDDSRNFWYNSGAIEWSGLEMIRFTR